MFYSDSSHPKSFDLGIPTHNLREDRTLSSLGGTEGPLKPKSDVQLKTTFCGDPRFHNVIGHTGLT